MTVPRVKICGITRLEDALLAAELGADALGFNFWPQSKRYCDPDNARAIVSRLPPFITSVGVFVNPDKQNALAIARQVRLSVIQLHGDESAAFCDNWDFPLIKGVQLKENFDFDTLRAFPVTALLLDSASPGYGGSGVALNFQLLEGKLLHRPLILAGGLTQDNVQPAIRAVRPYGIDVASGVESSPGIKDPLKMARFIQRAKEAFL